jgi:hypothetical protein
MPSLRISLFCHCEHVFIHYRYRWPGLYHKKPTEQHAAQLDKQNTILRIIRLWNLWGIYQVYLSHDLVAHSINRLLPIFHTPSRTCHHAQRAKEKRSNSHHLYPLNQIKTLATREKVAYPRQFQRGDQRAAMQRQPPLCLKKVCILYGSQHCGDILLALEPPAPGPLAAITEEDEVLMSAEGTGDDFGYYPDTRGYNIAPPDNGM